MFDPLISLLAGALAVLGTFFAGPQPEPIVGVALPQGAALFETSLQDRISSTDTSMSLVANSLSGGESVSGYNCFTIDEGRTDAEFVCGTVSGTTVSSLERGLSFANGTTSVTALKFAHRKGANVKITDFPLIQRLRNQSNGIETFPNLLRYETSLTPASGGDLVDYDFVTGLAFSGAGVIDATSAAKGVSELATQTEMASSTSSGSSGPLVIPASNATSTWNPNTAALRAVVTQNSGKIDNNFIASSSLFGYTFPTIGASSTSLQSNGTNLVFAKTWTLLSATTTQQAMDFATVTIPTADNVRVVWQLPRTQSNWQWNCQLNGDGGANYGYRTEVDFVVASSFSSQTQLVVAPAVNATTTNIQLDFEFNNSSSIAKIGTWDWIATAGTSSPMVERGFFGWNNTSALISSLSCGRGGVGAPVVPSGTVIRVYGM